MTTKIICFVSVDQNLIDAVLSACQSLDLKLNTFDSLDTILSYIASHPYDAIVVDSSLPSNGVNLNLWALEHVNMRAKFLTIKNTLDVAALKELLKKEIIATSPLDALRAEYARAIPEKIARLQTDLDNLRKELNEENLKALRFDVHKLAGNSGTYGFTDCSKLCKEFEQDLLLKLKQINEPLDKSNWLNEFHSRVEKISSSLTQI